MSISPLITFKAGICELAKNAPRKVKPLSTPGYIYLYSEDELIRFCWRPRSSPLEEPELDLFMPPGDGSFTPYQPASSENQKPLNGRIYVLKFSSSSDRHLFWLQSQSQHPQNDPSYFSSRDLRLGEIVNDLLQGEDVNIEQAIAEMSSGRNGGPGEDDDDEMMEDAEGTDPDRNRRPSGSGGAGADATGGDIREEGEQSREGGADGGRAAAGGLDANAIIQNFIKSVGSQGRGSAAPQETLFTTLADLLTSTSTIPWIESADTKLVDKLLQFLPPALVTLAQQADDPSGSSSEGAAIQALSLDQKKNILRRVLRSPQFSQSLASLTVALRDGGLPSISEALNIPVRNGGYMRRGGVPLGGGEAVQVFVEGVKDLVEKEDGGEDADKMETE